MGGRDDATQALRGVVTGYREFDQEIQSRALNRLWAFSDGSLAEALSSALADADYGCQLWAAKACGELGIRAAEPAIDRTAG